MVHIWKKSGSSNVHIESDKSSLDGVCCEITHDISLENGRITEFSVSAFGFSGMSSVYASALARVLDAAAAEMNRLEGVYVGTKSSDFVDVAIDRPA